MDAWTLAPKPLPDNSISQSYCWLKIRWRSHAAEAYLNLTHTLTSIGFHHKRLHCTSGMTQLMWEFTSFPFHSWHQQYVIRSLTRFWLEVGSQPLAQISVWLLKHVFAIPVFHSRNVRPLCFGSSVAGLVQLYLTQHFWILVIHDLEDRLY